MKILESIFKGLLPTAVIGMIVLIVQMNRLPGQIADAVVTFTGRGHDTTIYKDRVIIQPTKADFVYLNGVLTGRSDLLEDKFVYHSAYPVELWDGYITPFKCDNGASYYLWTRNQVSVPESGLKTKGWFVPIEGKFELGDQHVPLAFPVIERESKK